MKIDCNVQMSQFVFIDISCDDGWDVGIIMRNTLILILAEALIVAADASTARVDLF